MNQQELIADQRELLDKGHSLWAPALLLRQGAFNPPSTPKKIIIPVAVDKVTDTIKIKWDNWSKVKEKWAIAALDVSLTTTQAEGVGIKNE